MLRRSGSAIFFAPDDLYGAGIAAFFVVAGHNYNIFLGFAGGRGLATAAGVSLAMNPIPLVLFIVMYWTGFFVIRRNVHVASVIGVAGCAALLFNTPSGAIEIFSFVPIETPSKLKALWALIAVTIILRHVEPIKELVYGKKSKNGTSEEQR